MKKIWIYVAVIVPFAFFYEPLKAALSLPVFLGAGLVYFLLARAIAEKFGK